MTETEEMLLLGLGTTVCTVAGYWLWIRIWHWHQDCQSRKRQRLDH